MAKILTREKLQEIIKEVLFYREFYRDAEKTMVEKQEKAAPFGSGMERAKLDKEQAELIGHT